MGRPKGFEMTNKHTHPFTDNEIRRALRHNEQRPANLQTRLTGWLVIVLILVIVTVLVLVLR